MLPSYEMDIKRYIHPCLLPACWPRFIDGHYTDVIETAFEIISQRVLLMAKSRGLKIELSGVKLMTEAFSPKKHFIKLIAPPNSTAQSETDFQQGYMYLFAGAMSAIRNVAAHNKQYVGERDDAIRKLFFASMLMYELDKVEPYASAQLTYCPQKTQSEVDSCNLNGVSDLLRHLREEAKEETETWTDFEGPSLHLSRKQFTDEERKVMERRANEIAEEIEAQLKKESIK